MVQNKSDTSTGPAPRPRGRPRKYDPETALSAASSVFWRKGYEAASLDDLAAATGMNRPSLYAAFGDKEQLYLAALEFNARSMIAGVEAMTDADLDIRAFARTFFARASDLYLSGDESARGCFLTGTALTPAYVSEKVQAFVRKTFAHIDDLIEARFRKAKRAGELEKDADPRALALLTGSTLHELSILARTGAPRSALEERARLAIKMMRL